MVDGTSASEFRMRRERIALQTADMINAMRAAVNKQLDTFADIERDAAIDLVKGLGYTPEEAATMLRMNLQDLEECVEADEYAPSKRDLLAPPAPDSP